MSRIIYPEDFLQQTELLRKIRDKHIADGATSPLTAFLALHAIDLDDDDTAKDDATVHETNRLKWAGMSEDYNEKRDLKMDVVLKHIRKYYQFLKSFYKPNVGEVGNWGANITENGRIVYPPEFGDLVFMWNALKTKYETFPPGLSPLDPYLTQHGLTIAADHNLVLLALDFHNKFLEFEGKSEDATEDRDNVWNPVVEHEHKIGDFLKNLFNNNTKQLTYWGFAVDDSPRAPKVVTSKVKLSSSITISSIIIGGTLKNIGSIPLHIYKGKTVSGTPVTVPAGEMYGITKGYSTITVSNPSATTTGVFSCLRSK